MVTVVAQHDGLSMNGVGMMMVANGNRTDINSVFDAPGKIVSSVDACISEGCAARSRSRGGGGGGGGGGLFLILSLCEGRKVVSRKMIGG